MKTPLDLGPLTLVARELDGIRRQAEPVAAGVPVAAGRVRDPARVGLVDQDGRPVPVQTEVTDRWPDGSARWLLVHFAADLPAAGETHWSVLPDGPESPSPEQPVRCRPTERGVVVETGAASFVLERGAFRPFRSVRAGGVEQSDPARSSLELVDADGNEWSATADEISVTREGPVTVTVAVRGRFARAGADGPLELAARLHFFAGRASVRMDLTVRNPRPAAHPGGHWELGDAGSVLLRDLSLVLAAANGPRVSWSADPSSPLAEAAGPVEIYQDSSGGPHWQSRLHLTRDRTVPTTFRGYRVRVGEDERNGERATPRVAAHDGTSGVGLSLRWFWQNFPKALGAGSGVATLRLFPRQFSAPHEIQGGEQKTHTVWLHFGPEAVAGAADASRAPLVVAPDPATFVRSGAVPYLTERTAGPNELWHRLTDVAIEGDDTFDAKREKVDEWGWRHFGEIWADHESKFHEGSEAFASHYNNQYDVVNGAFLQFARTGDIRWFRIMEELARHVVDIDIYHTDSDKPAYNRGLFWHTVHYVDADLATHRSYPRRGSDGGGPDDEHNYTTGLMHWSFLTGEEDGRQTALDSARWVIDADDPDRTVLRWLDRSPTGLASKTRDFDYHGPGRGAGNSINALLDGWRLSGDRAFLGKCEELIRRTIHPGDDPEAMGLLDAENRWSYTVHLQALGKYLDAKAEAGEADAAYAYARDSLLTYARFITEHERPTLGEPTRLDHPTETWAAQDLRKCDVLLFAALHATGEERERFRERAEYFWRESLEELDRHETKTYMRPVIVLMHYGHLKVWMDGHPDESRPAGPAADPGPRERFVPQKIRALAKLKRIAAAGVAVFLAGTGLLLYRLLG